MKLEVLESFVTTGLNKGITFVDFHSVRKTPGTIDLLKNWKKEYLRLDQHILEEVVPRFYLDPSL